MTGRAPGRTLPNDKEITNEQKEVNALKILIVEPMKAPRRADIPHTLEAMQQVVGGYIEAVYPFDDPVVLVCNEEGKLKGYELNRRVPGDIIAGTFFLCTLAGEDFTDLSEALMRKYERVFEVPQMFVRTDRGIAAINLG